MDLPRDYRAALTELFEGSSSMLHRTEVAWRAAMNKNLKVRNGRAALRPGSRVPRSRPGFDLPRTDRLGFERPVAFVVTLKTGLIGH